MITTARPAPMIWAAMKPGTEAGAIPAKVSENIRPMVMAGLAKLVEDVKKHAAPMYAPTAAGAARLRPDRASAKITRIRPRVATTSDRKFSRLPRRRCSQPPGPGGMAEIGLDLSREFPKPLTGDQVQAADVVITMGCGDACPFYPGKRYLDWDLPDPAGLDTDAVRPIRDDIRRRVRQLLSELDATG